jgi:DNA transformation protein
MSEFIAYLHEVFEQLGPIEARKMFGGCGLYHEGTMFALVVADTLYLKADADTLQHFEAQGLGPFTYHQGGRVVEMSYYVAPPEVLEDQAEAALWARRSYQAALRSRSAPTQVKRRSKP